MGRLGERSRGGAALGGRLLMAWGALALTAGGCVVADESDEERVQYASSWIINGTPDTTRQAVVAVLGNGACTGTIIHTDPANGIGHVLTAAHCTGPQQVVIGNDYQFPSAVFPVIASQAHPSYNGQVYDFRMVRISGVNASTPVIPAMSPAQDNLSSGTQIRHVGYGKAGPAPGSNNTVRRQILGQIAQVSSLTVEYDQPSGGPCSGDSGGPQLTTSGQELVVGVTSFGDQNCNSFGVSGRVSAVYDNFIVPYINNAPIGPLDCDGCLQAATTGQGDCIGDVNACFNDNACANLVNCLNNCTTQSCVNQCAQQHQAGIPLYEAIFACVCNTACTMECANEPVCMQGGGSTSAAATSASATSSTSGVGGSGAGAGDPTAGAGADAAVGGGATVPPGDGWNAGDVGEEDYEGARLISSGCSVRSNERVPTDAWWLAAALGLLWPRRRRRR
ncbi:MAG TPA: hypothetical protein ENK57_17710 [Polyangiaceae bacterium]|nr:hypothetical protein [Polyangiaceae bacterium]